MKRVTHQQFLLKVACDCAYSFLMPWAQVHPGAMPEMRLLLPLLSSVSLKAAHSWMKSLPVNKHVFSLAVNFTSSLLDIPFYLLSLK